MTDGSRGMSEWTWYSRFAVWVGAAVLLLQSVTHRGAGFMSGLAALLIGVGFLGFVISLAWDARGGSMVLPSAPAEDVPGSSSTDSSVATETLRSSEQIATEPLAGNEPIATITGDPDHGMSDQGVPATADAPAGAEPVPPAREDVAPAMTSPPVARSEETQMQHLAVQRLASGNWLVSVTCVECDRTLGEGAIVTSCPACGRPQHVACWHDNGNACSASGCSGRGIPDLSPSSPEV